MKYTIKVWLFTCLLSPLVIALIWEIMNPLDQNSMMEFLNLYTFMALFGLTLSIPAMIVFGLVLIGLPKSYLINKVRLILSIYAFISVWISFYILDEGFITDGSEEFLWVISYSLTIVLGVYIFKLPKTIKVKLD